MRLAARHTGKRYAIRRDTDDRHPRGSDALSSAVLVGALYFAAVFAVGFVLGTVRVLVIAPRLGELASTLIELPIILTAAWLICGAIIKRLAVPRAPGARIAMGVVAFALLMAAEAGLSVALFGNTLESHIAGYRALPAATGLVGQVVFALFPWLQLRASDPGAA